MRVKSDIGILQEELPSGKVTTSSMRIMSFTALLAMFVYMGISYSSYEKHFSTYVKMATEKVISEQSFNSLTSQLKMFEEWVLLIFMAAAFAPKAIQKLIELRAGVNPDATQQ